MNVPERTPFPFNLFADIMLEAPAQPATNLWRAVEIQALSSKMALHLRECRAILDLGCGDGGIMAVLRPALCPEAAITGIDPDPAETELAAKRGLYAHTVTAGAERMPFAGQSFDAIISNSVLEHILPIHEVLAECRRVLKPGGWLIATVPGPDFHHGLRGAWLPWVTREQYRRDLDKRLAHFRYWTTEEWRQHMDREGLTLVETFEYLPQAILQRWELLSRLTGGLLYHLTGKKAAPIHIQRKMGLRRRLTIPKGLVRALAWILSRGLQEKPAGPYGGLLLVARKTA